MVPETRRSNFRTPAELQRLLRTLTICPLMNVPQKIKHKQLYIEENFRDLLVIVRTEDRILARFHCNPSLAEAVLMARSHCEKYHPGVPILEYILQ